jgi:hypothetical protein
MKNGFQLKRWKPCTPLGTRTLDTLIKS